MMKYTYGNVVLPCNNLEDLNTKDPSMDIVCRIYLKEAPDDIHEKIAKREDGDDYDPTCFFIECVAGKNEPEEPLVTSDWILGYIKENGRTIEFGWVDDVPDDAFDYFVKEIGAEV